MQRSRRTNLSNLLYVDDVNARANSVEVGYNFYLKAKQKCAENGFNLRQLCSNSRKLEQIVTKEFQKDN